MSPRDNEAIVRELHEAFNARDLDRSMMAGLGLMPRRKGRPASYLVYSRGG